MFDRQVAKNLVAISLGSNIDALTNLPAAVRELACFGSVKTVSKVYESLPVGFLDQPNFLNAAVLLETSQSLQEIKATTLKSIEEKLGRVRDPLNKNAPRTIDLDLSLFITPSESLLLDRDILTRAFVAVPLAELLPDFVPPETEQSLAQIAQSLADSSEPLIPRPDCDLSAFDVPRL